MIFELYFKTYFFMYYRKIGRVEKISCHIYMYIIILLLNYLKILITIVKNNKIKKIQKLF